MVTLVRISIPPDPPHSLGLATLVLARLAGRLVGGLLILFAIAAAAIVSSSNGALNGSTVGVLGAAAVMIALPAGIGIVLVRICRRPRATTHQRPAAAPSGSLSPPASLPPPTGTVPPSEPSVLQALASIIWTLVKTVFQIIYRLGIWLPIRVVSTLFRPIAALFGTTTSRRDPEYTISEVRILQSEDNDDEYFATNPHNRVYLEPASRSTPSGMTDEARRLDRIEKRQIDEERRQVKTRQDELWRADQEDRKRRQLEESRRRAEREAEQKRRLEESQKRAKEQAMRRKTFKVQYFLNNRTVDTVITANTRSHALEMARQQWPGAKNIHVWTT